MSHPTNKMRITHNMRISIHKNHVNQNNMIFKVHKLTKKYLLMYLLLIIKR